MTVLPLITLLLIAKSLTAFSQCIDRQKITYGGEWGFVDFIHRCPTYNFTYGGDISKNWNDLSDPIDINQAPKQVFKVKEYVEDSIKKHAGDLFFSKVKFNSVEVVYAKKNERI